MCFVSKFPGILSSSKKVTIEFWGHTRTISLNIGGYARRAHPKFSAFTLNYQTITHDRFSMVSAILWHHKLSCTVACCLHPVIKVMFNPVHQKQSAKLLALVRRRNYWITCIILSNYLIISYQIICHRIFKKAKTSGSHQKHQLWEH